jgi:hypothetical protein
MEGGKSFLDCLHLLFVSLTACKQFNYDVNEFLFLRGKGKNCPKLCFNGSPVH